MDGQGLPQPPPLAQNDPQGFYYWYVSQGFPPQMAQELTIQRFGPPKTAEERAREQAKAAEKYGFAKLGGQLVGSAGGIYASSKLAGLMGAKAGATGALGAKTGAVAVPKLLGGAKILGSGGAAASGTGAGALGSVASVALPAAAILGSAYTFNRIGKKTKTETGGKALKTAFKDPMSWLFPGAALVGALWGDKDMYLKEHRRLLDLQSRGIDVPEQFLEATRLEKGRGKEDLIAIEKEKEAAGQYSNVKFAETRDESDLNPEDIWGYSTFLDKFGNDWLGTFSEDQRRQIAQKALDAGAVNEHHGTVDIDWNKVDLPEDLSTLSVEQAMAPVQAEKGKVARQSAGLYRDDQGNLVKANSMRAALERAYKGKKSKNKNKEL